MEDYVFKLARNLHNFTYKHSQYQEFYVYDPKRRHIHKASVTDRLLHHAIFRVLAPIYDKKFIFDSYSSRLDKGTHKAQERFHDFAWKLSRNNTRDVWVLKCDIKKFFDSVDHQKLITILEKTVRDEKVIDLLKEIIHSFETRSGKGIPLGNFTSQLFSNVYMNVFDQYVKRGLRVNHYIRYADDFVILDIDKNKLLKLLPVISNFLNERLFLSVHPNKIYLRKFSQGIDFLGYVIFPYHSVLRTKTKKRILKKVKILKTNLDKGLITKNYFNQSLASYYGLLKHCRGKTIRKIIENIVS